VVASSFIQEACRAFGVTSCFNGVISMVLFQWCYFNGFISMVLYRSIDEIHDEIQIAGRLGMETANDSH
jgi:hypothetical protein